jgi:hypothetical protein
MALDHTNPGLVTKVLLPVKGDGVAVHYVEEVKRGDPLETMALCGTRGPLDGRGRARFRRAKKASAYCQTCHAAACVQVSRVKWD